jgi:biotin operon repressor
MRFRRHKTHHRHHRTELNSVNPDTLPWRPLPRPTHRGIVRSPRAKTAAMLPISAPQAEVLLLLTDELQSPGSVARQLDRSVSSVTSSLYALQERGLVEKVPYKGWKLTTTEENTR